MPLRSRPDPALPVARLALRVIPRASRDVVVGMRMGALLVRVTAAPVEGAANEAVARVLAKRLGVASRAVRIVGGQTSKSKVVEIEGLAVAEVWRLVGYDGPVAGEA
ncbi:MAG: DUF167 domain-containing protein [Dehalococcoidia bacterium]|nr:MAG: DUF167 domain-containing protein [Dehalococcoidia bacterium]